MWVEFPLFEIMKSTIRLDEAESREDYIGYLGNDEDDAEFFEQMNRFRENNIYSVKYGCDNGECGACTVIVNDKTQNSCLMLMHTNSIRINGLSRTGCRSIG